jgi:hypothetical protein
MTVSGLNQVQGVLMNFGGGVGPALGQFTGKFVGATRLVGVVLGPEAFGNPAAGPFAADSVPLELVRS